MFHGRRKGSQSIVICYFTVISGWVLATYLGVISSASGLERGGGGRRDSQRGPTLFCRIPLFSFSLFSYDRYLYQERSFRLRHVCSLRIMMIPGVRAFFWLGLEGDIDNITHFFLFVKLFLVHYVVRMKKKNSCISAPTPCIHTYTIVIGCILK